MTIRFNHLVATIDLDAIRHNFRLLDEKGGNACPVIKSDAYGHGLEHVARAVAAEGASIMAVGTVEEAVALRGEFDGEIIALLGALGDQDIHAVREHDIIPFVTSVEQISALGAVASESRPIGIALKLDTGMRRLGFAIAEDETFDILTKALESNPGVRVKVVGSHLATADEPESLAYVNSQAEAFSMFCSRLEEKGHSFRRTLANSAGILGHEGLHFDIQRAGISLYGGNPYVGTANEERGAGLKPAMHVTTRVLQTRTLRKGQSISYGCTYTAEKDMQVAIVAAGYADGYSRSLSNRGRMLINDKRVPIVGRVCMQMTAVEVTDAGDVCAGDTVHLLGGEGPQCITPDELAAWWGTISYEVLCILGLNERKYVNE